MAKTAQEFINEFNGKIVDYDHVYGAQCVDGFKCFCAWIGAPVLSTKTGWADGYWTYRHEYANYVKFITDPKNLQKGDWLFWAKGSSCRNSHVGMYVSNAGNGYGMIFGENQGGNGGFTTVKIKLDILGAFRFNALQQEVPMWKKNEKGWWYEYPDGSYPKNKWAKIDNKWYHFDKDGYMQTGWIKDAGKWYYLDASGVMVTGWKKVDDKWYYMNSSGAMMTGWIKDRGNWYFLESSGAMVTGERTVKAYFSASGALERK